MNLHTSKDARLQIRYRRFLTLEIPRYLGKGYFVS